MEESDSMTQDKSREKSLEMDADCLSFHTDSGDKALTLVRSVLTQRRQAMQVRLLSQLPPQTQGVSRPMCVLAS